MKRRHNTEPDGFTLVELVIILVLVGVIAAFAVPRFFGRGAFDARAYADQVRSMVAYGQKLAVAQHRPVFVRVDAGGVALCFDSACSSDAMLATAPAGGNSRSAATRAYCLLAGAYVERWFCEGLPDGVSMTRSGGVSVFSFDTLGRPALGAGAFPAQLDIAVGAEGVTHHILVEQETGYVHGS